MELTLLTALFGLILFAIFCSRCGEMRIGGYIFGFIMCLLWPVSFCFVILMSPPQWKILLDVLGIKTNDIK